MLVSCGRTEKPTEEPNRAARSTDVNTATENGEGVDKMKFEEFDNVNITGIDLSILTDDEKAVLYHQAKYCQAMTDADIDTLRELTAEDKTYTHMSGKRQTREEYFADIADGSLTYYTIGIADPVVKVNGDTATITYTSVLNADAYGARGTFRMKGTHSFNRTSGKWIEE